MKVRIKFSKHGVLKYIGHLDLMRYFQKAFRRTDIVVLYSKGFSPHMIMSFAQALGVGVESDGEYFDVEVADEEDVSTIKDRLNAVMAEGVCVLEAKKLPDNFKNAMASVKAASYEIKFNIEGFPSPFDKSAEKAYLEANSATYSKVTKTGEHIIDVKELVFDFKVEDNGDIYLLCDCSSANNLKPASFISALSKVCGIDDSLLKYHVFRLETYMENEQQKLVPLGCVE